MTFEKKLISVIASGEQNALHLEELSKALKCAPADVKRQIKKARMQGIPIISSNKGYWIAESKNELSTFKKRMIRGAFSRLETIAQFGSFLNKMDGQLEFKASIAEEKLHDEDGG